MPAEQRERVIALKEQQARHPTMESGNTRNFTHDGRSALLRRKANRSQSNASLGMRQHWSRSHGDSDDQLTLNVDHCDDRHRITLMI